jgi:hypothetical protein
MNPFAERYKTLSNADLLKITGNPSDYQPLAVEAAGAELTFRNLAEPQLAEAKAENEQQENEKQASAERKKAFQNKVRDISISFADAVNPVYETAPSTKRYNAILQAVFCLMFIFEFLNDFNYIKFLVLSSRGRGFSKSPVIIWLLPLVFLALTTGLLLRRKILGWILAGAFVVFSVVSSVTLFVFSVKRHFAYTEHSYYDRYILDSLISLLFYGGLLWLVARKDIREIYKTDKSAMIISASLGVLLAIAMFLRVL